MCTQACAGSRVQKFKVQGWGHECVQMVRLAHHERIFYRYAEPALSSVEGFKTSEKRREFQLFQTFQSFQTFVVPHRSGARNLGAWRRSHIRCIVSTVRKHGFAAPFAG